MKTSDEFVNMSINLKLTVINWFISFFCKNIKWELDLQIMMKSISLPGFENLTTTLLSLVLEKTGQAYLLSFWFPHIFQMHFLEKGVLPTLLSRIVQLKLWNLYVSQSISLCHFNLILQYWYICNTNNCIAKLKNNMVATDFRS